MADIDAYYIDGSGAFYDGQAVSQQEAVAVMRADDATLGRVVYFQVSDPTAAASQYTGPGPLSNIVTFKEL